MQSQAADIPVWLGILMFIAGIAITVALAKYMARREQKRNSIKANTQA